MGEAQGAESGHDVRNSGVRVSTGAELHSKRRGTCLVLLVGAVTAEVAGLAALVALSFIAVVAAAAALTVVLGAVLREVALLTADGAGAF